MEIRTNPDKSNKKLTHSIMITELLVCRPGVLQADKSHA